jgi:AcrR family transcriptional regulator
VTASEDAPIRDRLLDAAAAVFAERGYDGTKVGDIAKRAGLSTGAIYSQFQNKSDLLMRALVERATAGYDDTVAHLRTLPYEESLLGTARAFLQSTEPLLLDALAAAQRDEQLAEQLRADFRNQERESAAFVAAAQRAGTAPTDLSPAALARLSTVLRLGAHVLARLHFDPIDADDFAALSARLVSVLVAPQPRDGDRGRNE